jgi:acyl-CoA synthetase (AMP-forming)/AMP-acid ligase II/NAD(P)-dependent dehydrogenase (short-subunit alcohol dehydrogenase family)
MDDAAQMSELLPRPIRLLLGATGFEVSDRRLRDAVAGKVVLVTGASSGVGEATALRLGAAGATVLLVARRAELLDEICEEVVRSGGSAQAYPCNLADIDQVQQLVSDVLEDHGYVDIVVSNAGLSIRRWVTESYDRFHDVQRTIGVNYLGPVRLLLGLLPSMRERGSGHIVNVATIGVNFPALRWSAYVASKAAFEAWLGGVAPEIRADGVTTTSIHMQLVRSPMLGPFAMWNYLPGMSTDEAAGMVSRAIVDRPRVISPYWARIGGAVADLAQAPIEAALARYARSTNPESRRRAQPSPVGELVGGLANIAGSGVVRPIRPDRIVRALLAQTRYGTTPAAAAASAAALYGDRPAVIDELGTLTFGELDSQARALAAALHEHLDLGPGRGVAIMCRNHRGFVQAAVAATRLGCDIVPLNNDFAGPQLADVLAREGATAAVYDQEFEGLFDQAGFEGTRVVAWRDDGEPGRPTLEALIELGGSNPPAPPTPGRMVMLTSGTTGTPKGAIRAGISARALAPLALAGLLDLGRIEPLPRSGEPLVVAPPLFHLFGLIGMMAGFALGSPIVVRRRFEPEATLAQIERTHAGVLLAVPTMLKRMIDLPAETRERYDTSSLKMVLSGAAPLAPELAAAVMDEFGDVLYNGYASTEAGAGTLATPQDLRTAPGTVGRPAVGARIKIIDDEGLEVPTGNTGRIFIGSAMLFEGYTGGGGKQLIDGLMSTGDVGHFDSGGRLFIDGRDDDMILSGGENVFPQEVEDLLISHQAVADAAVFGVADEEFGQRLAANVVLKRDASMSEDELKAYVRARLARHKVPRQIAFVEELPRTSTGKLRRGKLSEAWSGPVQGS